MHVRCTLPEKRFLSYTTLHQGLGQTSVNKIITSEMTIRHSKILLFMNGMR